MGRVRRLQEQASTAHQRRSDDNEAGHEWSECHLWDAHIRDGRCRARRAAATASAGAIGHSEASRCTTSSLRAGIAVVAWTSTSAVLEVLLSALWHDWQVVASGVLNLPVLAWCWAL